MTGKLPCAAKCFCWRNKGKILAARRSNIKTIVLSEENRKDIGEIESRYTNDLTFHFIKEMKEVLPIVL